MKKPALAAGIIGLLTLVAAALIPPKPVVIRIIDGDTLEVSGSEHHIRLIGIDTAEVGECYRKESTAKTAGMLLGKQVRIVTDINSMDNFGRILAYVYLPDGTFVNKELLIKGAGMFFYDSVNLRYQKELISAAESARGKAVGLWKTCGPCLVKGNFDKNGRHWYHLPGFRHYDQVVVNLSDGDRWFCSEAEAVAAGLVKARE